MQSTRPPKHAHRRREALAELVTERRAFLLPEEGVSRPEAALAALRRIDEGTYGICEDCGRRIPEARLRLIPEATRCVKCEMEREIKGGAARRGGR